MLILASTSDIIRVVTGAAVAAGISAHASWLDNASGTVTPGRTNTAAITTATTTTVVGSPGSSTYRNVANLTLTNKSSTAASQVTVQHYDGSTSEDLIGVALLPGESLVLDREGVWHHYDAQGGEYQAAMPRAVMSGTYFAESVPREFCTETNTAALASGTLFMQAIYLRAGDLVSNLTWWSATTAANTPTNQLSGLYDTSLNQLAVSANGTTGAWAANTAKTFAMGTPYRVPSSRVYYAALMVTATAVPTIKGMPALTGGQLQAQSPALHATSSTGLTTSLPNPAGALTTGGTIGCLYVAAS